MYAKNAWEKYQGEALAELMKFNEEYKEFISVCKTEREAVQFSVELAEKYEIPHVPIIDDNYIFPDSIEELQSYVESAPSLIDGKPKEGIVFYDKATGAQYVKFVSPEYLLKFHG